MSTRERFWKVVCDRRRELSYLFGIGTALVVLAILSLLVSLFLTEPGSEVRSAGYVISVLNLGVLSVTLVLVGYCLWRCRKSRQGSNT